MKKKLPGKKAFVSWKNNTFYENAWAGNREKGVIALLISLTGKAKLKRKKRFQISHESFIAEGVFKAWQEGNHKFFSDIAATIKHVKKGGDSIVASPEASRLLGYFFEHFDEGKKKFSLNEIMKICDVNNKKTATVIRKSFYKWVKDSGYL
jgi:hypothetical protein